MKKKLRDACQYEKSKRDKIKDTNILTTVPTPDILAPQTGLNPNPQAADYISIVQKDFVTIDIFLLCIDSKLKKLGVLLLCRDLNKH